MRRAPSPLPLLPLLLAICGCPSEQPLPNDDDDDATTPALGEPGCPLSLTNDTSAPMTSVTTASSVGQFDAVELLDAPLPPGETRDIELEPSQHHLVTLDESGGWYEVGWVLCVWDETLAVAVQPEDLKPPGIELENGSSQDIVSLVLSPVGQLVWGPDLLAGDPLPQFSARSFPLEPGRWFALARNAEGLGYFANFELLTAPPQTQLGISRMFTVPGEPCTFRVENGHSEELVGMSFREQDTGMFLATLVPATPWLPPGDAVTGAFPPGNWDVEIQFFDGQSTTEQGVPCVDGDSYETVATP